MQCNLDFVSVFYRTHVTYLFRLHAVPLFVFLNLLQNICVGKHSNCTYWLSRLLGCSSHGSDMCGAIHCERLASQIIYAADKHAQQKATFGPHSSSRRAVLQVSSCHPSNWRHSSAVQDVLAEI